MAGQPCQESWPNQPSRLLPGSEQRSKPRGAARATSPPIRATSIMNQTACPRPRRADPATSLPTEHLLWHHAAFCRMALPVYASSGDWRREVGTATIRIAPAVGDPEMPSGRFLRLILMHVCDTAFRTGSAVVDMGQSAAMLAATIGVAIDEAGLSELAGEFARLASSKVVVSLDGGPLLAVFDARSNPRAAAKWRRSVRLNARFQADLAERAVPLDRRIVKALAASAAALDAYVWIRHSLAEMPAGAVASTPWADLLRLFGEPNQDSAVFRSGFEDALRCVFAADLSISIAVDDEGVSVRHATHEDDANAQALHGSPMTAPVQSHEVEGAELSTPPSPTEPVTGGQPQPPAAAGRERLRMISLRSDLTGLPQVVWLRRADGDRHIVIGVTPNAYLDMDRLTLIIVEPVVLQVSGGITDPVFERISAWVMVNRDLIDDFWESRIDSADEVFRRVRRAPAVGWR